MASSLNRVSSIYATPEIIWSYYKIVTTSALSALQSLYGNGYRPPEWGLKDTLTTYIIDMYGVGYFFDAIMRIEHDTTTRITEHPVQSGANLSDHAYQLPARVTLEVNMSDAMDVFQPGQFSSFSTKSISAYQQLLAFQKARLPLQIVTRLNQYDNMLIEHISAPDDVSSLHGLRCIVNLRQIMTAQVAQIIAVQSADKNTTDTTQKGVVQPLTEDKGSYLKQLIDKADALMGR
jgi:hypothetical protein